MQCTQTCVLASEASLTGQVDDQAGRSLVLLERYGLSSDCVHGDIVKGGHAAPDEKTDVDYFAGALKCPRREVSNAK